MALPWLFFALLAPVLWGAVNLLDKFLREKHLDTFTASVVIGLSSLWVVVLIPLLGLSEVFASLPVVALGLFAGFMFFANSFPYFHALSGEEASRVTPLWALEAPMTLAFAWALLGERLHVLDYVGFALVVSGAFLVSQRRLGKALDILKPSRAFFLMLLASLLASLGIIIMKQLYSELSFWAVYVLTGMGSSFAALFATAFLLGRKGSAAKTLPLLRKAALPLALRLIVVTAASLAFNLALLTGSASLSTALVQLSAVFVFAVAALFSRFLPHILEEEIGRKTLLTKAVAILVIVAGVFAMNL